MLIQGGGRARGEGGFTLIELLIIIAILGILAGIVVFAVQNLMGESSTASCQSDYKTVESAVEAYKAQMFQYPSTLAQMTSSATQPGTTNTVGPWLREVPSSTRYNLLLNTNVAFADTAYNASNLNLGNDGTLYVVTKNGTGADTAFPQWSNDLNASLYGPVGAKAYGDANIPNVSPAAPSYTKSGGTYSLGSYPGHTPAAACANVASAS